MLVAFKYACCKSGRCRAPSSKLISFLGRCGVQFSHHVGVCGDAYFILFTQLCKENVNHSHTIDAKLYHSPPSPTSLIKMHLLESGHTDKLFRRRYLKQITVYPLTWWLVNFINDWIRIRQNGLNKQRCRSQKWDQKTPTTTSRSTPGSQQKSGVR